MKRRQIAKSKEAPLEDLALIVRTHLVDSIDRLLKVFNPNDALPRRFNPHVPPSGSDFAASYERLRNVAQALMLWHSSDDFLTEDGMPIVLPRTGARSLRSLATRVTQREAQIRRLTTDLEVLKLVEPHEGGFAPAKRSAIVGSTNALSLVYATVAISRIIRTIAQNVSGATIPRYERQVSDVRIRSADLPVFLQFVEHQGQYLIDAVDDWLSARPCGTDSDTVSVGLGAFAWADDDHDAP